MGHGRLIGVLAVLAFLVAPAFPSGLLQSASATIVTPGFTVTPAPSSLPNYNNAGEPSIGVNWNTGNIMFQAYTSTYRINVSTGTPVWTSVTPLGSIINVDPILFTDHTTGRTFAGGLDGACSLLFYTDNDGGLWVPMPDACSYEGWDHQTIGGGPFAAPLTGGTPAYKDAVYYCSQSGLTSGPSGCAVSHDGGLTFVPGEPWALNCGGLHGHVKVGPDGYAYVPDSSCSGGQGVVVSGNNGLTWTPHTVSGITSTSQFDPSVAIGGNTTKQRQYFCARDGNGHPKVAVSSDHGSTWNMTTDVGTSLGLVNVEFPAAVAGDWDRAACAFLGTSKSGDTQASSFNGVWGLYVAYTYDAGSSWQLVNVSYPVQKGCIWAGGGSNTCRNLLDFMDAAIDAKGNVVVGFADGCTGACKTGGASNWDSRATIARQTEGSPLFAAYDPSGVGAPLAPTLSSSSASGRVDLSWTAPSNNGSTITSYKIYRGTTSGGETLLATVGTNTSYSDLTVTNGNTYYYKVTAVNGVGEGPASNEVSETPNPSAPAAPVLAAVPRSTGGVNLSWTTPSNNGAAITNYKIYRGTTSPPTALLATIGTNTTYSDLTTTNGTIYYYKVTAVNSVGEGAASNVASVTPPGSPPSEPRGVGASNGGLPVEGRASVLVHWSSPSSDGGFPVTQYNVYRDEGSGFQQIGSVTTMAYTDTDIIPGHTYTYKVTAVNSIGEGPASASVTITTTGPPPL